MTPRACRSRWPPVPERMLQRFVHEDAERVLAVAAERPAAAEAGTLVQADRRVLLRAGLEAQGPDAAAQGVLDRGQDRAADAAAARLGHDEHALQLGAAV